MEKKISLFGDMKQGKDFDKSRSKSKDKSMELAKDALLLAGGVAVFAGGVHILNEVLD